MVTKPATMTGLIQSEVRLSERSISPGLGMGQAWVVGDVLKWSGPPAPIGQNDVDSELLRLAHCVGETRSVPRHMYGRDGSCRKTTVELNASRG